MHVSRMSGRVLRRLVIWLAVLCIAFSFAGPLGLIVGIVVAIGFWLSVSDETGTPAPSTATTVKRGPPLLQLTMPSGACALCMGSERPLFASPRIVLCEKCVWAVRAEGAMDIGEAQRQLEIVIRTELRDQQIQQIEPLLKLALDGAFNRCDVDKYMALAGFEGWRICLRAYHLGLLSYPNDASRPDPATWDALAHGIRVQDGLRCVVCRMRNTPLHVHHIIPLSEGGTNDRRNLITLCHDCHLEQHPGGNFSRPDPLAVA